MALCAIDSDIDILILILIVYCIEIHAKVMSAKQAIIIGGSRGIGLAIATKFALCGYNIAIMSQNSHSITSGVQSIKSLCEQRNAKHVNVCGVVCDIRNEQTIKQSFKQIDKRFGDIEVLVNSAAINIDNLLVNVSLETINKIVTTNLIGTILTSKAILKPMIAQRKGSIINIGSIIGMTGNNGQSIYAATKSALIGFTKSLSKEVANKGISVNLIAPGFVSTDMTRNINETFIKQKVPLKRMAFSHEIAEAVYFIANASYITGEVLTIDGGLHLNI